MISLCIISKILFVSSIFIIILDEASLTSNLHEENKFELILKQAYLSVLNVFLPFFLRTGCFYNLGAFPSLDLLSGDHSWPNICELILRSGDISYYLSYWAAWRNHYFPVYSNSCIYDHH